MQDIDLCFLDLAFFPGRCDASWAHKISVFKNETPLYIEIWRKYLLYRFKQPKISFLSFYGLPSYPIKMNWEYLWQAFYQVGQ